MKKFILKNIENCTINVTNVEVTDFDFYGTSAKFTYDIIDKDTKLPVIKDEETELCRCFMGYDFDYDSIYNYLEMYMDEDPDNYYDEETDEWNLPNGMMEEIEDYYKEELACCYWDQMNEDPNFAEDIYKQIMDEDSWLFDEDTYYIIENGEKVHILNVEENYNGTKVTCDTLDIKKVYYIDTEDYVYLINNEVMLDAGCGYLMLMDEKFTKCIFTEDDLKRLEENGDFPGFYGGVGSVYYAGADDYKIAANY